LTEWYEDRDVPEMYAVTLTVYRVFACKEYGGSMYFAGSLERDPSESTGMPL
jgi:hypothetical protein